MQMALRMAGQHDFAEGVRALLVDKDNAPTFRPSDACQVDAADVAHLCSPLARGLPSDV